MITTKIKIYNGLKNKSVVYDEYEVGVNGVILITFWKQETLNDKPSHYEVMFKDNIAIEVYKYDLVYNRYDKQ